MQKIRADRVKTKVFETNLKKMPVPLRKGLEALKAQQADIKKLLASPAGQASFKKDPVGALESVGIKIDPSLRKVLRQNAHLGQELFRQEPVTLPTGQILQPKVKVHFSAD